MEEITLLVTYTLSLPYGAGVFTLLVRKNMVATKFFSSKVSSSISVQKKRACWSLFHSYMQMLVLFKTPSAQHFNYNS